jgi:hypothetical protein
MMFIAKLLQNHCKTLASFAFCSSVLSCCCCKRNLFIALVDFGFDLDEIVF